VKLVSHDQVGATVELSWDELRTISNSINEAVHELEAWEFPIRTGISVEFAKTLRDEIGQLLELQPKAK
jgi:hypothetical protein